MLTLVKKVITDSLAASQQQQQEFKKTQQGWLIVDFLVMLLNVFLSLIENFIRLLIPPEEKTLFNDTVLITGSGHGIGRALALQFAAEGATVICLDRDQEANEETCLLLSEAGYKDKVHHYRCDVTDREEVLRVSKVVETEVGAVTILVNNAGIMPCKPLSSQTHQQISAVFNVNILAHFWMLEAFLPNMRQSNNGHIVAISSMCGVSALPNLAPYCASKFAVRGLMDSLYEELRRDSSKVNLTSVYPYMVDTGLVKKPRSRFPEALKLISAEMVAENVVKAVKQNQREISIPSSLLTVANIMRFVPDRTHNIMKDFLDIGVDPDD